MLDQVSFLYSMKPGTVEKQKIFERNNLSNSSNYYQTIDSSLGLKAVIKKT